VPAGVWRYRQLGIQALEMLPSRLDRRGLGSIAVVLSCDTTSPGTMKYYNTGALEMGKNKLSWTYQSTLTAIWRSGWLARLLFTLPIVIDRE
jgi:hypothetical protein